VATLYARAVKRAVEIRGEEELAKELGVSTIKIRVWMSGISVPPPDVFLKVADILGEHALEELIHRPEGIPKV
jgi:hypothetical protein